MENTHSIKLQASMPNDEAKESPPQPSGASGSIGAFTGEDAKTASDAGARSMFAHLSLLDKLLGPLVLLAMILGVIIGRFASNVDVVLKGAQFEGVSIPIVVGLLVMMWPILTKGMHRDRNILIPVQYERLHIIASSRHLWRQIAISLVVNWIIAPLLMLALAWATLPDLPTYRTGVIMVGLARCIAMVMIWNQLAHGNVDYCAILVIINSILQIVLYSPLSLLFVNVISGRADGRLEYATTAKAVAIYLGIPLAAGIITRFGVISALGRKRFEGVFMKCFGPLALLGLLYTIIIIFASQARRILDNIGNVFRVFVPLICYFVLIWVSVFVAMYMMTKRQGTEKWGYEMAVVQAFTAGSNNFELAIAVCIAIYGANSDEALAATIGPLVEVPVMLLLTYVALWARKRWRWSGAASLSDEEKS